MSRISRETLTKLNAFLDSLPSEAHSKCTMCNEALTHLVKQAEAQTGAGTATVTRMLSEKINEGAAPADLVKGRSLLDKVRNTEGKRNIDNVKNKPEPKREVGNTDWYRSILPAFEMEVLNRFHMQSDKTLRAILIELSKESGIRFGLLGEWWKELDRGRNLQKRGRK